MGDPRSTDEKSSNVSRIGADKREGKSGKTAVMLPSNQISRWVIFPESGTVAKRTSRLEIWGTQKVR